VQALLKIISSPLPDNALLNKYRTENGYTDCYTTDISIPVSQTQYVYAFYTSFVFKLERFILKWAVTKPSTDSQAQQLANGKIDKFAAWSVEARTEDQLMMSDFLGRTKSWLMVAPSKTGTRLYFGTGIAPVVDSKTSQSSIGFGFHALLGFHKLYSVILLYSAKLRLIALSQDHPQSGWLDLAL
jgi:hypothetical protein